MACTPSLTKTASPTTRRAAGGLAPSVQDHGPRGGSAAAHAEDGDGGQLA